MKTKLITTLKSRVLLVDSYESVDDVYYHLSDNPLLKYKHIGKLKDLTDSDCEGLVEVGEDGFECFDYVTNKLGVFGFTPTESFMSALSSENVLFENTEINPIEFDKSHSDSGIKNGYDKYRYNQKRLYLVDLPTKSKQIKIWQAAEQNVFSPETLIFVEL